VNRLRVTRTIDAPVDRVWAILGKPDASPGEGVDVHVERAGAPDGTGLIRTVKVGVGTVREEVTRVGPGTRLEYRVISGAPVRDYSAQIAVDGVPVGGATVSWDVSFRPVLPGTGWLVCLLTKRTLNKVLDLVVERVR